MSIVIIGGNECMERAYCERCKDYGHRCKVYTRRHKDMAHVFGTPDLCILFTGTVSHNMVQVACDLAKNKNVTLARSRTSSLAALDHLLQQFVKEGKLNAASV